MDGVLRIPMKHFFINQISKIRLLGEIIQIFFLSTVNKIYHISDKLQIFKKLQYRRYIMTQYYKHYF